MKHIHVINRHGSRFRGGGCLVSPLYLFVDETLMGLTFNFDSTKIVPLR